MSRCSKYSILYHSCAASPHSVRTPCCGIAYIVTCRPQVACDTCYEISVLRSEVLLPALVRRRPHRAALLHANIFLSSYELEQLTRCLCQLRELIKIAKQKEGTMTNSDQVSHCAVITLGLSMLY